MPRKSQEIMKSYEGEASVTLTVDCITLGFDGNNFNVLLSKNKFSTDRIRWRILSEKIKDDDNLDYKAKYIVQKYIALEEIFVEQIQVYNKVSSKTGNRIFAVAYIALVNMNELQTAANLFHQTKWFPIEKVPNLNIESRNIINSTMQWLRYKSAQHPLLLELLPEKFTIPQFQQLYKELHQIEFDKRNFKKKVLSTGLLIKQKDKDKENSKRGAFYYKVHKKKYKEGLNIFMNFVSKPMSYLA